MEGLLEPKKLVMIKVTEHECVYVDEVSSINDWFEIFCGTCRRQLTRFDIRTSDKFVIHCPSCGLRVILSRKECRDLQNRVRGICSTCFGDERVPVTLDLGNGAKMPHIISCPVCSKEK